jgi:hypothetical protein
MALELEVFVTSRSKSFLCCEFLFLLIAPSESLRDDQYQVVMAAVLLQSLPPFELRAARQAVSRCVPNPFQNHAKSEPLQNRRLDEVANPGGHSDLSYFRRATRGDIMCNIIFTPLPFRKLVRDLLMCTFDRRRKPLD